MAKKDNTEPVLDGIPDQEAVTDQPTAETEGNTTEEEPKVPEETNPVAETLIELKHFVQNGTMGIGKEVYQIVDGIVKVKPEHEQEARDHISMGG